MEGGNYAPYFISRYTTFDQTRETSTFYYTMATWNPYTQVIMKTTIQSSPGATTGTTQTVGQASKASTPSSVTTTEPVETATLNNTWLVIAAVVAIVVVAVGFYLLRRKRPTNT
jgi:LPXTG-motif cell wall-anchored protein